jgi:DNA-binding response OmpR family regulator
MVLEDDDATREFLADNLRADSFGVVAASTAREAFNLLQIKNCDLLLLDVMLPDASGFEFCNRLRSSDGLAQRIDPNLPVIILTGRASENDRVRGFARGADDYIVKPTSPFRSLGSSSRVGRRTGTGMRSPDCVSCATDVQASLRTTGSIRP